LNAAQQNNENAHRLTALLYSLWLMGILFGVTAIIALFINVKRQKEVRGTYSHSHFLWQMVCFWVIVIGVIASVMLWPTELAQSIAFTCFVVWLACALLGMWALSKKRSMKIFGIRFGDGVPPSIPPRNRLVDNRNEEEPVSKTQ